MANMPALGGSPISFVDASGNQYSIPLPWISFPPAPAAPDPSAWPGWTGAAASEQVAITAWIGSLATEGYITAGAVAVPPPAFSIAARDAGSTGNDISITFANVTPNTATPASTTAQVTVSTTQVYQGLTATSIETVLGTEPLTGTQPGLAYVGTALATLPTAAAAAPFTETAGSYLFDVPGSGGGVLLPTNDPTSADSGLINAAIALGPAAGTFTLTLSWTKQATVALSALATTFGYILSIPTPPGGFAYPPAVGTVTLLGGADATTSSTPAATAAATVISG
jgi:hypothetical protein